MAQDVCMALNGAFKTKKKFLFTVNSILPQSF